ncbi:MAG: SIS domain-containing protein [Acidimicrobiales bacterium]|jgi:D-sedoheptulose 7-phosphate isomerase
MNLDRPFATAFVEENARAVVTLPIDDMLRGAEAIDSVRQQGNRVFIVGNGGSAATATHMACDLMKASSGTGRPPVRVHCLSDCTPAVTAWANDESFDVIFSAQLKIQAEPGDLLIVVTGSGRSPNVLRALEQARDSGIKTIGLLGMGGGPALDLCDVPVLVDSADYEVIENAHMVVGHLWAAYLREHGERSA